MKVYRNFIIKGTKLSDPFSKDLKWIDRRWISDYLLNSYGLTQSQAWNIANGYDKDKLHYCPVCGAELKFMRLSRGFNHYCSYTCSMKYNNYINPDKYRSSCDSNDKHYGWNSVLSSAKSARTKFLNRGDLSDECIFYFATTNNEFYPFKFGITINLSDRLFSFHSNYKSIHKVLTNTRLYVANLEYDLKIKLDQNHEYFDSTKFKLINSFIKEYTKVH